MTEDSSGAEPPRSADPHALARDWITIWQSELAALAADREAQETWQKLVSLWAEAAWTMVGAVAGVPPPPPGEHADGGSEPATAARPAPADAAPDPRDGEIARLGARLDALEQRLGAVERERRPARAAGGRAGKPRS